MEVALMPFGPLLAALEGIHDPRHPQGQRYSMSHLLLFSVLAVLAGATSYQKIITFIAIQRDRLNTAFGACLRRAPAVNTLRGLFLALDRDDLEDAFRHHARELNGAVPVTGKRTIALDGKTLRGRFDHLNDRAAAHVLKRLRQRRRPHPGPPGGGRVAGRDRGRADADEGTGSDRRA